MITSILKRILFAIPTLICLTLFLFLLTKMIPGDPAQMLLGERGNKEALAQLRAQMGLDQPLLVQYVQYMTHVLVEGDFGVSLSSKEPIRDILAAKFPATLELAILAILIASLIGIPAGILSARFPRTFVDFATMSTAVVGVSLPVFWLGLILMWVFGVYWQVLPLSGRIGLEFDYEPNTGFLLFDALFIQKDRELFFAGLQHILMPALTLGTIPMAFLARMTRSAMGEVLRSDYIRTAKAKGVSQIGILIKHALKNASLPITTMFGLQFGALLGGATITETIFAWPGMGSWLLEAVNSRDITALEGGVLVAASAIVLVNLCVDILYRFLDPRITYD